MSDHIKKVVEVSGQFEDGDYDCDASIRLDGEEYRLLTIRAVLPEPCVLGRLRTPEEMDREGFNGQFYQYPHGRFRITVEFWPE